MPDSLLTFFDRSDRVRLRVAGPDRVRFLNNLTTNDVKPLNQIGRGCEAFVTSPQGKTLGLVTLHAVPDAILLRADPAARDLLSRHFDKYGVFDEISVTDVSRSTSELHVVGPSLEAIAAVLERALAGTKDLDVTILNQAGDDLAAIVESPTGQPGLTLIGPSALPARLRSKTPAEWIAGSAEAFDALRIEAGTPLFGQDFTADNLPQELGRDARALHFSKGCYLGQETVARIDALGHVNRILKGLLLDDLAAPGSPLMFEGQAVGTITSTAWSPHRQRPIGLGMVRVRHANAGQELSYLHEGRTGRAIVQDLPFGITGHSD